MNQTIEVLFNDKCPICSREVEHYDRYASAMCLPVRFEPLSTTEFDDWGIDTTTAARRLHVRHDGHISTGVDAFIVLWRTMPRFRRLARIISSPVIYQIATVTYEFLLAPMLYRAHIRRQRRS